MGDNIPTEYAEKNADNLKDTPPYQWQRQVLSIFR